MIKSRVLHVRRENGDRHFYYLSDPESMKEVAQIAKSIEDVEKITLADREEIEPRFSRWTPLTHSSIKIEGAWWGLCDAEEFAAQLLRMRQENGDLF